jgi:hypothetical protein
MNNNPQKENIFIGSFLIGLVISFIVIMFPHLSNSQRTFMPISHGNYYTYADNIEWGSFKCAFGEIHQINSTGMTVAEFLSADLSFDQIMKSTFDHFGIMVIIALVLTGIISLFRIHENDQNKFEEIN